MEHSLMARKFAAQRTYQGSQTEFVAQSHGIQWRSSDFLSASRSHWNVFKPNLGRVNDILCCRTASSSSLKAEEMPAAGKSQRGQIMAVSAYDGGVTSEVRTSLSTSVPFHVPVQRPVSSTQTLGVESRTVVPVSPVLVKSFNVAGGSRLSGHVRISGAKNSALAVLAGSLCSSEEVCIRMVPDLVDIRRMLHILQSLGVDVLHSNSNVFVNARNLSSAEPCVESVQKLRAGFFVIGALVARRGEAMLALPGGCDIGSRPIDLHLRGLEALGAKVEVRQGRVHAWVPGGKRLKGGNFHFDFPSVGATETLMMAACLADGETVLSNVAQEPEVLDLASFLVSCGANIHGAGTSKLVIKGVKSLHSSEYSIIPDRIEAGTFLIAAAITRSAISLSPVVPHHLTAVVNKLRSIGCNIRNLCDDTLLVRSSPSLMSSETITAPYPGFPTDLQPQLMSLMTTCSGESIVKETVFESRMGHVEELQKLGAKINVVKSRAVISGKNMGSRLLGAPVKANDLRAGAALILAGMAADGITHIEGANHIDRGYERFDEKLCLLGANIERLP